MGKIDAIKKAVLYAHEKPEELAKIIAGTITDVATSVHIEGATSITIPSAESVTEEYKCSVASQYGDIMSGQTVTLALKESVTGVSVSDKTVTVTSEATKGSFILKATCGEITSELKVELVEGK